MEKLEAQTTEDKISFDLHLTVPLRPDTPFFKQGSPCVQSLSAFRCKFEAPGMFADPGRDERSLTAILSAELMNAVPHKFHVPDSFWPLNVLGFDERASSAMAFGMTNDSVHCTAERGYLTNWRVSLNGTRKVLISKWLHMHS